VAIKVKCGNYTARKESEISRRLILTCIGDGGATREEIATQCSRQKSSMSRRLKMLRDEGLIRIGGWISRTDELTGERAPGAPQAVYMLGNEPDAPRPKRLKKAKVQAKYEKKHRAIIALRKRAKLGQSNMWDQLRLAA
jgi:DNA-binding transcriptional ArsR family regulator